MDTVASGGEWFALAKDKSRGQVYVLPIVIQSTATRRLDPFDAASAIKCFLAQATEHLLEVVISARKAAMPSAYDLPELFRSLRDGEGL